MLSNPNRYRFFLFIAGILFLLYAFYKAFSIATAHIYVNGSTSWQYRIGFSITDTLFFVVWYGVLFFIAGGILLVGLSIRNIKANYWCIQIALWLAGISLWYCFNRSFSPFPANSLWIIVTAIGSIILLVLYMPVVRFLRWIERIQTPQEYS